MTVATPSLFLRATLLGLLSLTCHSFVSFTTERPVLHTRRNASWQLTMSLKPAAAPLMDAGKALARSGELLIDATTALDLYGGGLSAAGAMLRNSGDSVAQAAASMRFKTAGELVCDELREAATCLSEATDKMKLAVEEAHADENRVLAKQVESAVGPVRACGSALEAAGAGIMQKKPLTSIGAHLVGCGESMGKLSSCIRDFGSGLKESDESGQRMAFAAERMIKAGTILSGTKTEKPKGKAWLKG